MIPELFDCCVNLLIEGLENSDQDIISGLKGILDPSCHLYQNSFHYDNALSKVVCKVCSI